MTIINQYDNGKKKIGKFLSEEGKRGCKYPVSINDFLRNCEENDPGISAGYINSFIDGREAFLEEIKTRSICGARRKIIMRRWLDTCKNNKHFKEVFFHAINTEGYGLDPETIAWEWIKILNTKRQFFNFFEVSKKLSQKIQLYAMQRFIRYFLSFV